jgi:hypothetical protein
MVQEDFREERLRIENRSLATEPSLAHTTSNAAASPTIVKGTHNRG